MNFYKDDFLVKTEKINNSKNIFLLGTSEKGPLFEYVNVKTIQQLKDIYGTYGTLVDAFKQIAQAYPDDLFDMNIYLYKISGHEPIFDMGFMKFSGISTDKDLYNKASITIIENRLTFIYPSLNKQFSYDLYDDFLVDKINFDLNNPIKVINYKDDYLLRLQDVPSQTHCTYDYIDSGVDVTKNQLYCYLRKAYELLLGVNINTIVPVGAYCDDSHPDFKFDDFKDTTTSAILSSSDDYLNILDANKQARFYKQLQLFCFCQSNFGVATKGVIGFSPNNTKKNSNDFIQKAYSTLDRCDLKDNGFFISVAIGDIEYEHMVDNFYILYACMLNKTKPQESTTNIPIPTTVKPLDNFLDDDINFMTMNGIVSYRYSILNGFVIHCGVTFSNHNSHYYYIENFKVASHINELIKQSTRQFTGANVYNITEGNKLPKCIDANLRPLVGKEIETYSFYFNIYKTEFVISIDIVTIKNGQIIKLTSSNKIQQKGGSVNEL